VVQSLIDKGFAWLHGVSSLLTSCYQKSEKPSSATAECGVQ